MRLAFVCDTPYQILTATNLYWTSFIDKKKSADLYIVNQFKDAEKIYNNLKKENMFDNVYFLKREENRFMSSGIKRYLRVAYSYLNPMHAIKNQMAAKDIKAVKCSYDMVFASVMTCFVSALNKLNKDAVFSLFDDGMGSYSGDIVNSGGGFAYRTFSWITKTGAYAKRADCLYVNNKELCRSNAANSIWQIPKITEEYLAVANRIFSIEETLEKNKNVIFLSQPSTGLQSLEEDMDRLVAVLESYKEKITVRLHPRETDFEKYKNFQIDTSKEFWELKIAKMDMDDKVLIGDYSTAQITPKLLFDKEPYLLLTYQMAKTYTTEEKKSFDYVVNDIREHYRDKSKVMIPKDENEFKHYLETLIR